jgi:uracil-DNA glycosylase
VIENGVILTGSDAELFRSALAEVKTKFYQETETTLDDTQALNTLLSSLRTVKTEEPEKKRRHVYFNPGKHLVLGTLVGRPDAQRK